MAAESPLAEFARRGVEMLRREDPVLFGLIERELHRQQHSLALVASCSTAHPSVLACEGTYTSNVTAEGYPGARFHAGCVNVDQFEQLAIDRAKAAFHAQYANVQPHSASTANQIVMGTLLQPGATILGLDLDAGGHLSHGARVNISGKFFNAVSYGLTPDGVIDFEQVERLARQHRPRLIISGTTAYSRTIDWKRFRAIADEVGAYMLADITHIAGLVIAGEHPNPIDVAHITTTCTHKQLYGPRGGLILMGKDWQHVESEGQPTLAERLQKGVFPFVQGAPLVNKIVAKARALDRALTPEFKRLGQRIVTLARGLAAALAERGCRVMSGGTDNHIVVVDVLTTFGVTGINAQRALEECAIIVNKNRIAGDSKPMLTTSGIRLGTNSVAVREMGTAEMGLCADLICRILQRVQVEGDRKYTLRENDRDGFREEVTQLCRRFPLIGYPTTH